MNKQELIKKYKELWDEHSPFHEPVPYTSMVELFLKDLKQLDEQKPVKVPQYVAEYINLQKKNNFHVYGAMRVIEDHYDKKVPEWFYGKNIETFVRAWLDGYEVEKEKRYLVKVKGMNRINGCLAYNKEFDTWYFGISGNSKNHSTNHTRKELEEANFGWVFDCEGVEVKELENE